MRADDGVEIFYRVWGEAGGPPVVLQHGFSSHGELEWADTGVAGALTAAGRRVVALDARGHGRSGKPHDAAFYGEARMADDLMAVLDHLGESAFDLAGYSMGAIVSLLVATRDPRVRRLFVGGIGAAAVELGGVDRRVLDPLVLREAMLSDDPSTIADPGAAAFRAHVDATGADRLALAAHSAVVHRDPIPLEQIAVTTLVLAGRQDTLADRPQVLAAAIPGARLHLLDGDHGSVLREPEFVATLVGFLTA